MPVRIIEQTPSAYSYPLLIKHLLIPPLTYAPDQEIVYSDKNRYTYRTFAKRVARLANALTGLGVHPGDTVAVMDWDSHRYLECFFAVPMMGAVLHTINIRLSLEQLIYTINHARDDVILVHTAFLPLLSTIRDRFETVKKIILLADEAPAQKTPLEIDGEYEDLLSASGTDYDFPDFDENATATTFYTTGTTGLPKGVYFSHRQLVIHTYGTLAALCVTNLHARITPLDVYMPLTPMFHVHAWGIPYVMTLMGNKQVYPGQYEPIKLLKLIATEGVTFSHCVPTILFMLLNSPAVEAVDLSHWKVIIGGAALPKPLCRKGLELGINVSAAYGMSETCPVLTIATLKPHMLEWDMERQLEVRCRTGLPIPEVDLDIVEADIQGFFAAFAEKGAIPRYGVPEKVVFVDEIPKTSVGKINKKALRETYV